MNHTPFEYGGLHFIPERQFEPAGENHRLIHVSRLRMDVELGFCKKGYAYPSKFNYSHKDFYAASTDKECDIFRCVENGRLYVPCENDLQIYEEPPNQGDKNRSGSDGKGQSRYAQRKEKNDEYRSKIRRFTFQLSLHDGEVREWFERQPDKGAYLKRLILEDKERELCEQQEEPILQESASKNRMAGDYEIIHAMHIGDLEIVLGENPAGAGDERYMCAFCQKNELLACYTDVMVSSDYAELVKLFGERVAVQAEKTHIALNGPKIQGIPNAPITAEGCEVIGHQYDLKGKVVVIKPEALRPEYRRATCQLQLCTGGFGASPNSRGSACFCTELYSGKTSRFERNDILGIIAPEKLPKWAKHYLDSIKQQARQAEKKAKDREGR